MCFIGLSMNAIILNNIAERHNERSCTINDSLHLSSFGSEAHLVPKFMLGYAKFLYKLIRASAPSLFKGQFSQNLT